MNTTKQLKNLKIKLIKALANKDNAGAEQIQKAVDDLEPGYVYYEEDGTRVKLPSGWFEEALMADQDDDDDN